MTTKSTFHLPDAVLKQNIGIIGRTGSGKTFTAKTIVERLLDSKSRVCVIDPTGVWWGLRSSADGRKAGYPVVIFGGGHADVSISRESGPALAKLIAERNLPCVIDLSHMLIGDRHYFMEHFAEVLHQLNRQPLELVIDEADEFAPQNPLPETRRMSHQIDRIVRRGRAKGFRVILISQRPAALHKNVLGQVATLIAMQLTSPQDRKAAEGWVHDQADTDKGKEVLASLPRLRTGEGWVWSPLLDMLERGTFPRIKTFDSSKTPEEGDVAAPETLASVDLREIEQSLVSDIARAKENDPALLRKRITELERAVAAAKTASPSPAPRIEVQRVEVPTLPEDVKASWADAGQTLSGLQADLKRIEGELATVMASMNAAMQKAAKPAPRVATPSAQPVACPRVTDPALSTLPKAERRILTALAQHGACTKRKVAVLAGYALKGGGFNNAMSALRTQNFVTAGEPFDITESGVIALGDYELLPTGDALLEYWLNTLPKAEQAILKAVAAAYPAALSKEDIAVATGYTAGGGGFNNALSKLRTLELVSGSKDIKASEVLFK